MWTFICITCFSIQVGGWELLEKANVVREYDDFLLQEVDRLKFTDEIRSKEGQKFTLEGFVIPLSTEGDQQYFVLSRFPYQSCFFCGAAGPETVVEVYSVKSIKTMDQKVRVTGILKLNEFDPLHLAYMLTDAEVEIL